MVAMSTRQRLIALAGFAGLHLLVLAPTLGDRSYILDHGFRLQAEAIAGGARAYGEVGFEYPPLALGVFWLAGKLAVTQNDFQLAFQGQMLFFDLAIVTLLAMFVARRPERVLAALVAYSAGVFVISGIGPLPDSDIELSPLALARFDLLPAGLVLAAALAREAGRSATWSALLSAGVGVKAFPALLFGPWLRGEREPARIAVALAIPLMVAAGIVIGAGDEFGSAIHYHSGRDLQLETVGATPLLLAHQWLGLDAGVIVGGGSFNLDAPGAAAVRWISLGVMALLYLMLLNTAWRRRPPVFVMSTAVLAVAIVCSPVLSPQFLFWVLPVSAVAFGLGRPNRVLIGAAFMTQVALSQYTGVRDLESGFVLAAAARNALLVTFLVMVIRAALRQEPDAHPV